MRTIDAQLKKLLRDQGLLTERKRTTARLLTRALSPLGLKVVMNARKPGARAQGRRGQ